MSLEFLINQPVRKVKIFKSWWQLIIKSLIAYNIASNYIDRSYKFIIEIYKIRSYNICINLIPFNTSVDVNDVIEYGTNNLFGLLIQIFHNRHIFYLLFFTLLNFFSYGFTWQLLKISIYFQQSVLMFKFQEGQFIIWNIASDCLMPNVQFFSYTMERKIASVV